MRRRTVLLLTVASLALAACAGAPPVAEVNGEEITLDDLVAFNPAHGDDRRNAEQLRDDLVTLVLRRAVATAALDDFGLEVTPDEVRAFLEDPPPEVRVGVDQLQADVDAGVLSATAADLLVSRFLLNRKLAPVVATAPDALTALYETSPGFFVTGCVRGVLVESEALGLEVIERIEGGEDMGAIADEFDEGGQRNGGLFVDQVTGECNLLFQDSFSPEFLDYEIGELQGPVESALGWFVLRVEERIGPASVEELLADPERFTTDRARGLLLDGWISAAESNAEITIDPVIGTWVPQASSIVAP